MNRLHTPRAALFAAVTLSFFILIAQLHAQQFRTDGNTNLSTNLVLPQTE
jgi:hypothetical protein